MAVISFEKIVSALFVFSLVGISLNASGVFDTSIPTQDMNATQATVTSMASTTDNPGETYFDSIVGPIKLLGKAISFVIGLGMSVKNLPNMLDAWGIPGYVTAMIMGMVFLSFALWIVSWWTGRRQT